MVSRLLDNMKKREKGSLDATTPVCGKTRLTRFEARSRSFPCNHLPLCPRGQRRGQKDQSCAWLWDAKQRRVGNNPVNLYHRRDTSPSAFEGDFKVVRTEKVGERLKSMVCNSPFAWATATCDNPGPLGSFPDKSAPGPGSSRTMMRRRPGRRRGRFLRQRCATRTSVQYRSSFIEIP